MYKQNEQLANSCNFKKEGKMNQLLKSKDGSFHDLLFINIGCIEECCKRSFTAMVSKVLV
jgi:hypothetical protein